MSMEPEIHYVAVISVTRVTKTERTSRNGVNSQEIVDREKVTVANISVSGKRLDVLVERVGKHLDLIEDGGEIEGRVKR